MKKIKLDKSEKELLAVFEEAQFKSVLTPERKKRIQSMAEEKVKKDKRK